MNKTIKLNMVKERGGVPNGTPPSFMLLSDSISARSGEGNEVKTSLASRLAEAREARGLTPAELSAKSGVSKSVISRLENAERDDLRLSDATRLCRALGISLDFLAGLNRSRSSASKVRKLLASALSVIDGDEED